jgi:hypothetical protein
MPTLQLSAPVRQNFLARHLVTDQWVTVAFIASSSGCRYTWSLFRPNSMSIAITCEQTGAKETLLIASIKPRKSRVFPELESFRKD